MLRRISVFLALTAMAVHTLLLPKAAARLVPLKPLPDAPNAHAKDLCWFMEGYFCSLYLTWLSEHEPRMKDICSHFNGNLSSRFHLVTGTSLSADGTEAVLTAADFNLTPSQPRRHVVVFSVRNGFYPEKFVVLGAEIGKAFSKSPPMSRVDCQHLQMTTSPPTHAWSTIGPTPAPPTPEVFPITSLMHSKLPKAKGNPVHSVNGGTEGVPTTNTALMETPPPIKPNDIAGDSVDAALSEPGIFTKLPVWVVVTAAVIGVVACLALIVITFTVVLKAYQRPAGSRLHGGTAARTYTRGSDCMPQRMAADAIAVVMPQSTAPCSDRQLFSGSTELDPQQLRQRQQQQQQQQLEPQPQHQHHHQQQQQQMILDLSVNINTSSTVSPEQHQAQPQGCEEATQLAEQESSGAKSEAQEDSNSAVGLPVQDDSNSACPEGHERAKQEEKLAADNSTAPCRRDLYTGQGTVICDDVGPVGTCDVPRSGLTLDAVTDVLPSGLDGHHYAELPQWQMQTSVRDRDTHMRTLAYWKSSAAVHRLPFHGHLSYSYGSVACRGHRRSDKRCCHEHSLCVELN